MNLINTDTKIYAVVGYPVKHSKSPYLFNQLFNHANINNIYLSFDHQDAHKLITAMKTLNIQGYSVTVPHKESFFNLIDEPDLLSSKLKCINTVVNKNGKLYGYNTDGYGAIDAIENQEKLLKQKIGSWKKKKITFLGCGGATRGITLTMALRSFTGTIEIIARNELKAKKLIIDLDKMGVKTKFSHWSCLKHNFVLHADLIINSTTLGMIVDGKSTPSPLNMEHIDKSTIVFDLVYTPLNTDLLNMTLKKGAKIIDGLDMFLSQANRQLFLWTKKKYPLSTLKKFFKTQI